MSVLSLFTWPRARSHASEDTSKQSVCFCTFGSMDRLKGQICFLAAFKCLSDKQRVLLLNNATQAQSLVLGDIAANVLVGELKLNPQAKKSLLKYKTFLRCIGAKGTSHVERRRCIQKHPRAALVLIELTRDKIQRLVKTAKKTT